MRRDGDAHSCRVTGNWERRECVAAVRVDRSREADDAALLREYEQRRFERSEYGASILSDAEPVKACCERCGEISRFPAVQRGSVQACPKRRASVDVGPIEDGDEWWKAGGEDDVEYGA